MNSKKTGNKGEDIAFNYLKKKKYKILERNWQNKWGEIDIIAKKKNVLVFVEVKTLRLASLAQGRPSEFSPFDEINEKKKKQLLKMQEIYLSSNKMSLETPRRIDIIGIELFNDEQKIIHLENVFEDNF